ncbi:MAG: ankyrin repeat domain-containing protein [Puniceicoccales bacterium]|nr:ankyrin repeat domain-containing protein [Puniceicoccales bacterium]
MKITKSIIYNLFVGSFLFTGVMGTMIPLQGSERYLQWIKNMTCEERTEQLFHKLQEGSSSVEKIQALINSGVNIHARVKGNTLLHWAIDAWSRNVNKNNYFDIIQALVSQGAVLNSVNNDLPGTRRVPLDFAINVIIAAMKAKVDVNEVLKNIEILLVGGARIQGARIHRHVYTYIKNAVENDNGTHFYNAYLDGTPIGRIEKTPEVRAAMWKFLKLIDKHKAILDDR